MTGRRWQFLGVWLLAALGLGGALIAAQLSRSGLDDPDLALQRPGFLDAQGTPFPAPRITDTIPSAGRRAVIFFTRPQFAPPLGQALLKDPALRARAQVAVVVSAELPSPIAPEVPVIADPGGRLATAYAMRRPRDGGFPVGYAIVDRAGRVRYRTLDPHVAERLDEVETMLRATP
jgi:hypothetical protein